MSNGYVVTSKEVRPEFTAELLYDHSPENPREWGTQVTVIYFWNDEHEELSDSRDIRSYDEAIRELYQKVYPELVVTWEVGGSSGVVNFSAMLYEKDNN